LLKNAPRNTLGLVADNKTKAYFHAKHFSLVVIPATAAGVDEYDEIMRAEQLMGQEKTP
jgi:hypothetical protein